ncbi:efflux RND transporter periplasmic adaptor subunit [Fusobacterium varium]|nr:efflux RND transporter periplasmic adaptor subunit [Fusobacterium ulcerans]
MKKTGYLILLLILVMTGCGKKQEEVIEKKVKYVITEPATMRKMNQVFKSDAVLEPKNKVDHKTEKGGTIEKILKRNGDAVKKGELVMELSDAATESSYFTAKANYTSALSSLNIAKNNYQKFKNLYEKELVSYLEYVGYENTYVSAKGNYEAAKASYENAKSDYDKLFRKAEIDGIVGNLFGKEGNEISSSEIIFTVVNDKSMETYVGFPAEWLTQIKVGQDLEVEVGALGKKFVGKILEINPIADSTTKKYMIKIAVDNPDRVIKDGMYSYVTIPVGEINVLSVSDEAIFVRNLLSYVFKVEDGVAKRVEVKTGATNLPYTEISSDNVKEGDRIVVKGIFGLEEGNEVEENTEAK